MTRPLATLALGAAALSCLAAWCVERHRNRDLRLRVEAYEDEDWHTADEVAAFAGRCAWHAGSTMAVPPIVEDHLRESFIAGYRTEEAREIAGAEMWDAGAVR